MVTAAPFWVVVTFSVSWMGWMFPIPWHLAKPPEMTLPLVSGVEEGGAFVLPYCHWEEVVKLPLLIADF